MAGSSVSAFLSTLIPVAVIAAIMFLIFVTMRKKQGRVYEPRNRVQTLSKDLQTESPPSGMFSWLTHLMKKPESFIIQQTGIDGYFFSRFLFGIAGICFVGCCILWPILFPVNATNGHGKKGFDILSYANVKNEYRNFAHVFLSWLFFGVVIFIIYRELVYYVTFKHAAQSTPLYDSLLSSRTLLLTEIPESMYNEAGLRDYFPTATNIWFARDYEELQEKVKERTKLTGKYEGALNLTLTKAQKLRNKALKKNKPVPEPADDINKYLKDGKKRPTHKLKFLIGEKVDTLDYCPEKLGELNRDIKKDQLEHQSNTQIPAVFIEFPTQLELQKAYQAIPYNPDFKRVRRYNHLAPDDIIWENLSLTPAKRIIKKTIASTVLTLLIIFWCIPVAFVGAISNVDSLIEILPFLSFINNMPSVIMGIITGLLPVVLLAVLMMLVPIFIRKMGQVAGCLSIQEVEKYCQAWYYAFQVVNVFIVTTLGSAAASTVSPIISDPTSALNLLGENIPPASNFYVSYFCLQGLSVSTGLLAQVVALILAQFLGKILDKTPRAKWNRWNTLKQPIWSLLYPPMQLLAAISLVYAIIAPLILGFSFVAFVLIYLAYMYVLVYVFRPNLHDARGRYYASGLLQLFCGIYLGEVCLIALFIFKKNWATVALEGAMILFTAVCHVYMKWKLMPLFDIVPISALKYAAGDSTFQYPMHDQGRKEMQVEGKNYWEGGNQLGLAESPKDQVLSKPVNNGSSSDDINHNNATIIGSDESAKHDDHSRFTHDSKAPFNTGKSGDLEKDAPDAVAAPHTTSAPKGNFLTRFFKPRAVTFDMVRAKMPGCYFNYVEYNPEFVRSAYDDPSVKDEEPHIWIPRDEMGLSEIEKNKALEHGVDVSDDNATYDEKGGVMYTGEPPSYEEAIRV